MMCAGNHSLLLLQTISAQSNGRWILLCNQFYTTQYAGDMPALSGHQALTLLQAWSEEDFQRVQENLIGHLVTQKRLKLSPTLFLATTPDEMEVVSLCNLTGEVVLEKIGTKQRTTLAPSLSLFLQELQPQVI